MDACPCPTTETCPFFNDAIPGLPAASAKYKRCYCLSDNSECARFMVRSALGANQVPLDLLPHQVERAKALIGG